MTGTFPSKLVRIVISFAVGGSSDANARMIAPPLTERWKQQIVIDPRPGAATILGTSSPSAVFPDAPLITIVAGITPQ